nr:hypothetical protein [Micromonospora hortensis]
MTQQTTNRISSVRRPPPQGIPTVRAFQQAQADALLPWLATRLR